MAARNKPYDQFGHYILFKKLESDSLSELWRAAGLEGNSLGPLVALRRFTGGKRDAIESSAAIASRIVPLLSGTSFAKQQVIGVIDRTPFVAHEYAGGRSLRYIVEKSRGGTGAQPNPMPLDQAIIIAEKVALSLVTTADFRFEANRLSHGALLPQFVWITDDGEIRVAGQQLGAGLLASLRDPLVAAEIGRYVAPEARATGMQSKTADSYAIGALLYLLVTGVEPPDTWNASAFTKAVRGAKTTSGAPIPDDIRSVLDKSLVLDPAARAPIAEIKQAISALAHSGYYSATTFNLAFYASTLLKKELEGEAIDRERESRVNLAPYVAALAAATDLAAAPPVPAAPTASMFDAVAETSKPRSKAPLAIGAVLVVAAIGGGAFFMFRSQSSAPRPATAAAQNAAAVPPRRPVIVSQPLVAAATSTSTPATTNTTAGEAARKQAFEAAVQQKMQEEMMKMQADYTKKLQQTQSRQAPAQVATATAAPSPAPARTVKPEEPSATQLDQQRLLAARNEAPAAQKITPATQTQAGASPAPAPAIQAAPAVREGDIVDLASLDTPPRVTRQSTPIYPPMALRQKAEALIILTALISETGEVTDVQILRGQATYGFNDAAIRAVRSTRFSPGMKNGKRVKTWFPIPVQFKQ